MEEFKDKRNEVKDYQTSLESYQKWQDKTLAYYANAKLTEKETEEISNEERIQRFQKIMNERYGKKEITERLRKCSKTIWKKKKTLDGS